MDAWPLIEAAVIASLSGGPVARDHEHLERRRAPLDRLYRALAPAGGAARVRPTGTSDEGDAVAAALFEAGVRAIEIAPGIEPRELIATVEAIAACVRHAARAPLDPRRPRLSNEHVELRTTPIGERGDAGDREALLDATREVEAAALTALLRARSAARSARAARPRASDAGGRFSRASWDERFAELSVDAAIAEVRASSPTPPPAAAPTPWSTRPRASSEPPSRPAIPSHALDSLARRGLEDGLAEAVRSWLEGAMPSRAPGGEGS